VAKGGRVLMLKLTKPPYADTEVDAEKTQQDITQLLRKYGVSQINWQIDYDMEQVQLDFVIEYMKQEDQTTHRIAVRVKPPMFAAKRRTWDPKLGRYKKEEMANWAQSMRLLFYWIKAKLEAVSFGLNSVEKEFLSDIITTLPDGSKMTVWDMISRQMANNSLMLEFKEAGF
jgi:tRNA nucleotidyltransferase (CCA-adding enzyme)